MEVNAAKSTTELPVDFENVVDLVEYAEKTTATNVSISIQKLGDETCLFLSADSRISHPKKLLKAQPGSENSKTKFARGWRSLGDSLILLTKVTNEDSTTYKISVSLLNQEDSIDSINDEPMITGSASFDMNFDLLSGEDHLQHALEVLNLPKKKRLLKLLKMMTNDDEMLAVIPLKRSGAQTGLQIGINGDDIVCKKTAISYSLKIYLSVVFLVPKLNITVENSPVLDNLWIRSLTQTETRCFTLPISSSPPLEDSDERDRKIMMTCGYSSAWPLASCMLCYRHGRLVQCIVPKRRSRSMYKFVGIIHEIDVQHSPVQRKLMDVCWEHYLAETDVLRSRPIKLTKLDEEWKRCVSCSKWSQVTQPLEDGHDPVCSNFNVLISCDDPVDKVLPPVGSNKVPPTPATARKRKRPTVSDIRATSPVDFKLARTCDMQSDDENDDNDDHQSSPRKSPRKSKSVVKTSPKTKSPKKERSPAKSVSPMKEMSPTKKTNSPKKRSLLLPSPTPSRGSSVFDFKVNNEADIVADSLSDEGDIDQTTPEISVKHNNSSIDTGNTTILSLGVTHTAGGDDAAATNKLTGYYSLSDDEDPKALQIKQLKSELSRSNKRLELLRSASAKFLDLLLMNESSDDEPVVKEDASPEEIVSILMSFVEDTDGHKSKLLRKRLSYK